MAGSHLSAVTDGEPAVGDVVEIGLGPESAARRIRQLQREARSLAREQIESFARDLERMAQRAAEIAEGGEAYAVGARQLASRIADDLVQKAQTLITINGRGG
jgi:CRP-like cAMP-binding protein